jgi:hypothetical protein
VAGDAFSNFCVVFPRIKQGYKQIFDTLISEEALLFAKYLRKEKSVWNPRLVDI